MASDVVQFREESEILAFLRARGINPNEFSRELLESAVRRLRAEEKTKRLARIQARLDRPVADIIREMRDEH